MKNFTGQKFGLILKDNNTIKEFQWKCTHNIIYTESRLRKMNLSNGRCYLCKESNIQEDLLTFVF